ncbi:MAG TPA: hypothetical protein VNU44_18275 [Bryobacteraceae bacterium]|jgi:hypothetical protein|nr:hypothetical protein [Bryobacteraceae bacterium]
MRKLAILAGMLIAIGAPQVKAQSICFASHLQGTYSFVASGTFGGAGFAAAGYGTYDGNGGVNGVIQASVGGTVTPVLPWTGSYVVNTDCTATKTITIPGLGPNGTPLTVHFFITAGSAFSELRFIATDPTTVITGTARRR